ncbi:hypothetical protein N7491_000246 [Penicillium cf. griseofulvum]|nr:hypothetical protein N7491_000246 [Penicillium cf. griseofulvum]
MAAQQGPSRRNGVIGFHMMGAPAPAIPLIAPHPSNTSNNQGPPHRINPLVGPDTAHSTFWGQSTAPSQTQRDLSALSARLADAESIVHRQESELADARSQASALKAQLAKQRSTTRFVDQNEMDRMIRQSTNNRSKDIDAQLTIIDCRLDEVSEDLERAKGNKAALQDWQRRTLKDQTDVKELRAIVSGAQYNMQQHARLKAVETRFQGLLRSMENMLAVAMQDTRASQLRTLKPPNAESTTNNLVGIARYPVVGSQQLSSHGHTFDSQPQQLDKGKGRGPRTLPPEEWECDGDLIRIRKLPNAESGTNNPVGVASYPVVESQQLSSHGHTFDIQPQQLDKGKGRGPRTLPPEEPECDIELTSDCDESELSSDVMSLDSRVASREGSPMSVCVEGTGQELSVVASDLDNKSQLSCFQLVKPNGLGFDGYMTWEPGHAQTITSRKLELGRLNHGFMDWELARTRVAAIVDLSHDDQPSRKKMMTKEKVKANGSILLSSSEVYVMNTVPKMPEVSVSAVSQPAQSVHVSTEDVPTQVVMSAPAVPQPTQTAFEATLHGSVVLESTMLASFVSIPSDEVTRAPAPSELAPTESAQTEPSSTEEIPSVPAVTKPTPNQSDMTWQPEYEPVVPSVSIPSDEAARAPAPSELAPTESAQTEPSSTEEIPSVPAVTKPTPNQSDTTWQPEDELVVPSLRTGTRSHLDVLLARHAARTQARSTIMSSSEGLQATATSPIICTSSLVASPEDASVKNAVATGTDSRAGVSKGTKRVQDAETTTRSAQQSAGEQRGEMGGAKAATSGLQMPGAWPSGPPAVTASDESDMQEGSALQKGLWTGTRWLFFGVCAMVMVILLSFPLWAGHLGHLVYALEGPEQFLEELRWEHGYDVPLVEQIIFFFLRCFAGDRTLFG